ncbi:fatty acid desaturase [Kineobactrum sediminis]|uniref:Fatty acid desaturase n=1 Tax=Kineobactrum sediminis TaxID=1905677 RepID=A0A2N5XZK3_9GAMM|nr:fatty acid desaturase family protein [Kineobactrum sediminis]PLW81574.1 fatty acid desaturase [Kineobactrum sediminis]
MKIADYLSREDIARFTAKSDAHAWRLVLGNWLAIIAIFVVVGLYPQPLTILLAVPLLAGRQLGLAVLTHEAGHRTLFRTPWLNTVVGQWFCALPVFNDMPSYARGHLRHHQLAGSRDDPDLANYAAYPVSRASFRRKLARDLSGRTGFKLLAAIGRGAAGITSSERRASARPFLAQLLVQGLMIAVLAAFGIAWAYLLWLGTFVTAYMLVIRIRQIAEHAAVPDLYHPDPRMNTRTVDAPWWQRLLLAPNGVNYHLEHHFMASVPCYRLAALRRHLQAGHALDGVPQFNGYGPLLRHVVV